jgi:outer membrane receptor protein involved in Fe transport
MNRFHPVSLAFFVSMLVVGAGAEARAEDDLTDIQGLLTEKVVTAASKTAEDASSAPGLVTSIPAEALRQHGITTLAEAIDFLSAGAFTSDDLAGGEIGARGVLLRGDRGSHFLLLVDGHAMNEPLSGSARFGVGAGIPIEIVDHIEVIVGPGSVLYGSNAMLGLINVVTKRAKDFAGLRLIAESAVPTSVRVGVGVGKRFELRGTEGEVTSELQYYRQRGPSLFFGAENTGIDTFTGSPGRHTRALVGTGIWGGANAKNDIYVDAPSGIFRLVLGDTEVDLRGSYYRHGDPTGPGNFDDAETGSRESRFSFDVRHRRTVSTLLQTSLRLYGDSYRIDSDEIASRGDLCPFGLITCDFANSGTALWGGAELQSSWDWLKDQSFVTMAGVDLRARRFTASSAVLDAETGHSVYPSGPELRYQDGTVGAYLQQIWSPTARFNLNGGARVDYDQRFPIVVTPRLAASVNAWKGGTAKLSYAEAFRAPSWDETDNHTPFRIQSDPLKPEKVRSVDGSIEQKFGSHRFVVSGFYARWSNLVELAALSSAEAIQAIRDGKTAVPYTAGVQLTQYRNVSEILNYGATTGVDGSFAEDHFRYGLSVTGAIADLQEAGTTQRLPVAPEIFGNTRVSVVPGGKLPTLAFAAQFMGRRVADRAYAGMFTPVPYAPPQLDLRFAVTGLVPAVRGLSYRLIANYALADRGPYVVGPVTTALPTQPNAQLNPIDTFRLTLGLEYAWQ